MPDTAHDSPKANAASEAKSPLVAGLLALAANLETSPRAALFAFFVATVAAFYSFHKLQVDLDITAHQCAGLDAALLALLFCFHTFPILRDGRRKAKLAQITGTTKPGYFQLAPREDEATFERADGKHEEVLRWLRSPPSKVLYLTGSSGTGKSSLLAAWVLPKLEKEGVKIIRLRGYQDPAKALDVELKRPGAIWKRNPPNTANLKALFEEARLHIRPARILVVFDQFEEFLILQDEEQRAQFVEFLSSQAALPPAGSAILLVFRAEYDGFIQNLNLPVPIPGQSLQKVAAFTQRDAQDFLVNSGLRIEDQLLADVLREAAEVEETKGLIRPVTLNLCGLVLSRFAKGLPHSFRPGNLIRGFVHEAIFQRELGEASRILIPRLISKQVTKQPCSIETLARGTSFSVRQVQGVMFDLAEPKRGIVRALDPDNNVWEISHDFLVPMIDSMLLHWRVSAWRRVRPLLPLVYAVGILSALFLAPKFSPDPIAELSRLGWSLQPIDATHSGQMFHFENEVGYELTSHSVPPPESVRALKRLPSPFWVALEEIDSFDSKHFGGWTQLANLRGLYVSGHLSDISAIANMPKSLHSLTLNDCDRLTDAILRYLPRSLTALDLRNDQKITDAGLKDLPRSLSSLILDNDYLITDAGLKDLPRSLNALDLRNNFRITDAGLKDLPRSLTSLTLNDDGEITDAGLKDLPRSLTSLELNGDDKITDAGLKDLPRSLTSLEFDGDNKITDAGLKDLPRSLTFLALGHCKMISDVGLKDLPRSLTWLELSNNDKITGAGSKDLPRSLKELDLSYNDKLTNAGLKELPTSLKSLDIAGDHQITDAGLKDLPRSLTDLDVAGDYGLTRAALRDLHVSPFYKMGDSY